MLLALAARIDSPAETGAAVASLVARYTEVLTTVGKLGRRNVDVLDEVAARAARKLSGA